MYGTIKDGASSTNMSSVRAGRSGVTGASAEPAAAFLPSIPPWFSIAAPAAAATGELPTTPGELSRLRELNCAPGLALAFARMPALLAFASRLAALLFTFGDVTPAEARFVAPRCAPPPLFIIVLVSIITSVGSLPPAAPPAALFISSDFCPLRLTGVFALATPPATVAAAAAGTASFSFAKPPSSTRISLLLVAGLVALSAAATGSPLSRFWGDSSPSESELILTVLLLVSFSDRTVAPSSSAFDSLCPLVGAAAAASCSSPPSTSIGSSSSTSVTCCCGCLAATTGGSSSPPAEPFAVPFSASTATTSPSSSSSSTSMVSISSDSLLVDSFFSSVACFDGSVASPSPLRLLGSVASLLLSAALEDKWEKPANDCRAQ
uniref:Uncharacterized protein n=1 Tax=Anopheles coluzzii TaxID=1518534 RepID=A0A8W7PXR8_ANOCL